MEEGKENVLQGNHSRRNSRRSSILKDSPGRKPLESMTDTARQQNQRRSLKRVSFADTKTIKEFLATVGNATEWNSTYEATASLESSGSMDITGIADRSIRIHEDMPEEKLGPKSGSSDIDESTKASSGTSSTSDNTLDSSNFLNDFLEIEPSKSLSSTTLGQVSPKEEVGSPTDDNFLEVFLNSKSSQSTSDSKDDLKSKIEEKPSTSEQQGKYMAAPISATAFHTEDTFSTNQMDALLNDDVAQMMFADLKMTCTEAKRSGTSSQMSGGGFMNKREEKTGDKGLENLLHGNLSAKACADMNEKAQTSILHVEVKTSLDMKAEVEMTQKFHADMEMTCPANQMTKLNHTQKLEANMEITYPTSEMAKLTQADHTQKVTTDMEMTCPANQMTKLTQADHTQKMTTDMEMTCPANRMTKFDNTQKLNADMEMTCPVSQITKLTRADHMQKLTADMEMTCPANQLIKLNHTQKMATDMEMTYPANEMTRADHTQKLTADMEMTCPANQLTKLNHTQKMATDMEMTCPTNEMIRADHTPKLTADMEMTCPANQMTKLTPAISTHTPSMQMDNTCSNSQSTQKDHTQKLLTDMEMTCPINQSSKDDLTRQMTSDMEMTCAAKKIVREGVADHTRKKTSDMELTSPAEEIFKVTQGGDCNQMTTDMDMTCPSIQMSRPNQTNSAQNKFAMERTYPGSEVTRLTQDEHTQMMSNMEMTCPVPQKSDDTDAYQNARHSRLSLAQITNDMEMTCSSSQVTRLSHPGRVEAEHTHKVTTDMEMTCPANQMSKLTQADHTQKMTGDMEMTCPSNEMAKLTQADHTQKVTGDMEMTCPSNEMAKLTQADHTQKVTGDMEMTCSSNELAKLTQADHTQKVTGDMEMTCPSNELAKLTQTDHTQKIAADMEMTCPTSQLALSSKSDHTQNIMPEMEITCPSNQIGKLSQSDHTHLITNMEITKPNQDDHTQKIVSDMEITSSLKEVIETNEADVACKKITRRRSVLPSSHVTEEFTCSQVEEEENKKISQEEKVSEVPNIDSLAMKDTTGVFSSNKTGMSFRSQNRKSILNIDRSSLSKQTSQAIGMILHETAGREDILCEGASREVNESGLTRKLDLLELTQPCHEVGDSNEGADTTSEPAHKSLSQEMILDDSKFGGKESLSIGGDLKSSILKGFVESASEKPLSKGLNVTCPASRVSEMIKNMPQRKSLGVALTTPFADLHSTTGRGEKNGSGSAEAGKPRELVPLEEADHNPNREIPSRKSLLIMSPNLDKTCDLSRPLFRSFFDEPEDCNSNNTVTKSTEECHDNRNKEEQTPPRQGVKRLSTMEDSEEHSPKIRVTNNGPVAVSLSKAASSLSSEENQDAPLSSVVGDSDDMQLHISLTQSCLPCEETSMEVSGPVPSSLEGPHPVDMEKSLEQEDHKDLKNQSASEEGLEDIQMDFDHSVELSLSHSPTKLENQTSYSHSPTSKSVFDSVAADALSSVNDMLTSFKKRVSEVHERSIFFEKEQDLDESCEMGETSRNRSHTQMSLLQLSKTCMDSGEDNEAHHSPCQNSKEDDEKGLVGSQSANRTQGFTSFLCDNNTSKVSLHEQEQSFVDIPQNTSKPATSEQESCLDIPEAQASMQKDSSPDEDRVVADALKSGVESTTKANKAVGEDKKIDSESSLKENEKQDDPLVSKKDNPPTTKDENVSKKVTSFGSSGKPVLDSLVQRYKLNENACLLCSGSDVHIGSSIQPTSGTGRWILSGASDGVRYLTLQFSPLELALNVRKTDNHWTVTTATWKPQVADLNNKDSQLVMRVLGCRIKAAVLQLYGLAICELGDVLEKVTAAYEDVTTFLLELQMVKTAYLTTATVNGLKVNLFNTRRHVNVIVTIDVSPPNPTPELPYTVRPTAAVTIGNLRSQTVQEAIAEVANGPKYILRLLRAASLVVQGMA